MTAAQVDVRAFERRYQGGRGPWSFGRSAHELSRYSTIMTSLRKAQYGVAYEPGCSIGVLTAQLAAVATQVIACDFAPSAEEAARLSCAGEFNVEIVCADACTYAPAVPLDLIIFSEIGYYFEPPRLVRLVARLASGLGPGSEFLAAHWLGDGADHVLHAGRVQEIIAQCRLLRALRSARYPSFRLNSWIRA